MATGINLMLIGMYIVANTTTNLDRNDSLQVDPNRYKWEPDLEKIDLSIAQQNLKSKNVVIPKRIRVTTLDSPPYSAIYNDSGVIKGNLSSYAFFVFDTIASKLNISYEVVMPDPPILGDKKRGLIRVLMNGQADMAVALLPMNPDMYPFISYSPMLTTLDLKVMMRRPDYSAIGSGLLAPFTTQVWIYILIAVAISGPIVFAITTMRCYLWNKSETDKYTFLQCVWFTYGAILKQGSVIIPETDSNRVLFASWWIFITILTSFYTANLTAFLTLSEFTLPYHTIGDVVEDDQKWTAANERYIDWALKQTRISELEILKTSYDEGYGQFVKTPSDADILSILRNKKLFIGEGNRFERIIVDDYLEKARENMPRNIRCTYVVMPEQIYEQPVAFAYPKNSPIQEIIDQQLRHLVETGQFKHLEQIKLAGVRYCPLNLNLIERKLKINDLLLTLKIIAGGFTLASLMLFYEITRKRKKRFCCSIICQCCKKRKIVIQEPISNLPRQRQVNNYFDNNYSGVGKPPPIYEQISNIDYIKGKNFNGRDYWEIDSPQGRKRLIPMRTPSAILFQYRK